MDELPSFGEFLKAAPIATLTLVIAGIGWYARAKSAEHHINSLKEFIEYLKNRNEK